MKSSKAVWGLVHTSAVAIETLTTQRDEARELAARRTVESNALLTEYSNWLMEHGYLDCDWLVECGKDQTAVDEFLSERMPSNG